MGKRANGGVLGVVNTPTTNKASGLWSLAEVALYKKAGTWPSIATFALSVDSASVNKGGSFTVTLTTTGVSDGTLVPYTITGIASGDLSSGSLTGNFTVTSNTGSLTFTTASSGGTSGDLTATFTCGGDTETITIQEGDTYFKYVTALLHGDGTNAANNNTFTDSSSNNFTITRNGDTTQGTFTPYGDTWSNYFPGTSGSDISFADSSQFEFTGDFTIEAFVYPTALGTYNAVIAHWQPGTAAGCSFALSINSSKRLVFAYGIGGSIASDVIGTSTTVELNTWSHICVSRNSGTIRLFVNGTQDSTTRTGATGTLSNSPNGIFVGSNTGADLYTGYISNLRVLGGTGVTSVTVPTTTLTAITNTILLTCHSNRFKDSSSNAFATTYVGPSVSVQKFSPFSPTAAYSTSGLGGSAYFDGSGDWLNGPSHSALAIGTGQYSFEMWIYFTTVTNANEIFRTTSSTTSGCFTIYYSGGSLQVVATGGGGATTASWTPAAGQWYHITATRDASNNQRLFVNGVLLASAVSTNNYAQSGFTLGAGTVSGAVNGYISDARLIVGSIPTSYQTSSTTANTTVFTPPTAPLTTTSQGASSPALLLNFTNAGIIDNAMMNDWVTVGDVQINTTTKKYGSGSLKFDGTGDYLMPISSGSNAVQALGTGDFTIEMWIYPTSFTGQSNANTVFDYRPYNTNGLYPFLFMNLTTGYLTYYVNSANAIATSSAPTQNSWNHIALVRSSGSTKLYLNGTQVGSTYTDTNNYLSAIGRPAIGVSGYFLTADYFTGYIDDLRITKGYARYTSNFTAPTGPFQDR